MSLCLLFIFASWNKKHLIQSLISLLIFTINFYSFTQVLDYFSFNESETKQKEKVLSIIIFILLLSRNGTVIIIIIIYIDILLCRLLLSFFVKFFSFDILYIFFCVDLPVIIVISHLLIWQSIWWWLPEWMNVFFCNFTFKLYDIHIHIQ